MCEKSVNSKKFKCEYLNVKRLGFFLFNGRSEPKQNNFSNLNNL